MAAKVPMGMMDCFRTWIENEIACHDYTPEQIDACLAAEGYHREKPPEPAAVKNGDYVRAREINPGEHFAVVKVGNAVAAYVPIFNPPVAPAAVARALNYTQDHDPNKPSLEHYMKANHSAVWNDGAEPIFVTHPKRDVLEIQANAYMNVQIRDAHRIRIEFDPNY